MTYYTIHENRTVWFGDAAGLGNAVPGARFDESNPGERLERFCPGVIVPVVDQIPIPEINPYSLFKKIRGRCGYILESMEGLPRRAVRSIVGLEPEIILDIGDGLEAGCNEKYQEIFSSVTGDNPLLIFRNISEKLMFNGLPGMGYVGGFVGYCSYDLVNSLTRGMVKARMADGPLIRLMLSTRGIVYDHIQGTCSLFDDLVLTREDDPEVEYRRACERIASLKTRIAEISSSGDHSDNTSPKRLLETATSPSQEKFEDMVGRAKAHIMAGDIFQVVLSRRINCSFSGDPLRVYGAIRSINPSPYLYYLDFGDEAVIGSSPEMLVKVEGTTLTTVPIAGTRPRGRTLEEDDVLASELLADQKERAEHLMLVDLARNDIGRVSEFGSVRVPEFYAVEKFSHVQHIVSRVEGTLAGGKDRFDALASCFPAGTVSGAPKIRAMQIIAELEESPRGIYAGAVGYAGFNELLEFAIAIRTVRIKDGIAEFSTGAGIVADSVPKKEFEETEFKALAMVRALVQSGESL